MPASSASLRFSLLREAVSPWQGPPPSYTAPWRDAIVAADGLAWTGLFPAADGDRALNGLAFASGTILSKPGGALTVDWDAAGTGVVVRSELGWNAIKNLALSEFTGAALTIENLVDVALTLSANTTGQAVSVLGAKRGKIDLGSGDDTLVITVDSNAAGLGNTIHVNAGGGNDTVSISASAFDYTATGGLGGPRLESWTTTIIDLGAGDDSVVGMGANDAVIGGAGDDVAELRGGTNSFDGGADVDTAVFRGLRANYLIEDLGASRWRITDLLPATDGDDGVTTVVNVEKLAFLDQEVLLGVTPPGAGLRVTLFRDAVAPGQGSATDYAAPWRDVVVTGNGLAWTGLFDSGNGDQVITTLGFASGAALSKAGGAFSVDWDVTGTSASVRNELGWNAVKNIALDAFSGATLTVENFVDVLLTVASNSDDQDIAIKGAKRGKIDLGAGDDTLTVDVDSNVGGAGGTFLLNTDGGDDAVVVRRSAFDYTATGGFTAAFNEAWTTTIVDLGEGADSFVGMGSNDTVLGGEGNDTAELRGGTNRFEGGGGFDTAVFRGARATYELTDLGNDTWRVVDTAAAADGDDGTTVVVGVEKLVFKDQDVLLGTAPNTVDAVDDAVAAEANVLLAIAAATLLANDTDPEGDSFAITAVGTAANGTTALVAGSVVYTPDAGFSGTDSFTYTITDSAGATDTATVTVTVAPPPPPVANDDAFSVAEDSALTVFDILANDAAAAGLTLEILTQPANGVASLEASGTAVNFTPDADFNGTDSFTYRLTDAFGGTDTATVTVTVTPVNDAPVSSADAASTPFGTAVVIDVLANDDDVDGDELSAVIEGAPASGTATVNADGTITYTPDAGFSGVDTFFYRASDGTAEGALTAVTVTVGPADPNQAPIANDDSFTFSDAFGGFSASLFLNDGDPDGDTLTIIANTTPDRGTLTVTSFGSFTYIPALGVDDGPVTFTYTVSDGELTDTATVTLIIEDTTPILVADTYTVIAGQVLTVPNPGVMGNDIRGGFFSGFSQPANGTVTADPPIEVEAGLPPIAGNFTYTPNAGFTGVDTFTYTVSTELESVTATVTITVTNEAPVARDDETATFEDFPFTASVGGNDTDADGHALSFALVGDAPEGLVFEDDGSYTYTPPENFNGIVTFEYVASDGFGGSDQATVTITVIAVSDPPVANPDSAITPFETAVVIDVIANDTDEDGDALSVLFDTQPANGTAAVNADGTVTYTPDAGFSGVDTFRYRAFDGTGFGNVATVTVTVGQPGNRAPEAADTAFSEPEDYAGTLFSLAGLTTDPDDNAVLWTIDSVTGGTITGFDPASGLGTFVPTANFNGAASINWTVTDAGGLSDSGTIAITITPVNDVPVAAPDAFVIQEGRALTVAAPGVLANDDDIDGDAVELSGFSPVSANGGTVTMASNGSFTYTPPAGFVGTDTFTYSVTDGLSFSTSATVTVTVIEGTPIAEGESYSVAWNGVLVVAGPGLLANDSDPNGDAITTVSASSVSANGGTVSLASDGSFTYTPPSGFVGVDSFTYVVSDGVLTSAPATVTIAVTNTTPVAVADAYAVQEGRSLTIAAPGVLANDGDGDGDAIDLSSFAPVSANGGTVTMASNGSFTYMPPVGFTGIDTFVYRISDGVSFSPDATVTVTVTEGTPIAAADSYSVAAGGTLVVAGPGLLANDSDPNGDAFAAVVTAAASANGGTVTVAADGSFTYTPPSGFVGVDSFSYAISDGVLTSAAATVTVTVTAPDNTAPVAVDDSVTIDEDVAFPGPRAFNVLANDTDADGDPLVVTGASLVGSAPVVVSFNAGEVTYAVTQANWNGSFGVSYTVSDGEGGTDTGVLTVTVTPVDDGPVANADFLTGTEDVPLVFSIAAQLLANDTHPDGATALAGTVFDGIGTLGFGLVSVTPAGDQLTVVAAPDFTGSTFFTYTIRDADGDTSLAIANVNILPINDAPVANDDAVTRTGGASQTIAAAVLLANDSDADNSNANGADDDTLAIVGVEAISGGTVTLNADQSITIGFTGGPVRFRYTLSDGEVTDTAVVTLNEAPVAEDNAITILENVGWTNYHFVSVLGNDNDPDGDALAITAVAPLNGAPLIVDVIGDQVRFYVNDSSNNTNGTFQIQYTVTDGLATDTGVITVTVTPENDPPRDPQANDVALGLVTAEDEPLVISVAALLADDVNPADEVQVALLDSVLAAGGGTIVNNNDGTLTFTPGTNFNGQAAFYYRAKDDLGAVGDLVWVPVTVVPVNDPLTAVNDIIPRQFAGGGTQTITRAQLLGNDTDADGDAVIVGASIISGITSLTLNADQSVTITYGAGQIPQFTYQIADGDHASSATVTLNSGPQVTGTPQALTWTEDVTDWRFDSVLIALAGITDPDGDTLQIVDFEPGANFAVSEAFWDTSAPFFNYAYFRPFPEDWNGNTTLTFTVSDGNAATNLTVTINVVVQPVNDAPRDTTAAPGYGSAGYSTDGVFAGTEETSITILKSTLLADDVDPEGGTVTWNSAFAVSGGSITDNGDSITFTPFTNQAGQVRAFAYYAEDSAGLFSVPIYVVVDLANTPDPIVAGDDRLVRTSGATQTVTAAEMLGNDSDPDAPYGDTKDIASVVAGNGVASVTLNGDDSVLVTFAADGTYTGRAFYDYVVVDSTGNTDTARVFLSRAPTAVNDGTFTLDEGQNYVFIPYAALLGNDTDPDADTLFFTGWNWSYAGSNVSVSTGWFDGGQSGLRAYLTDSTYTGPAEFQYRAWDGVAYSNVATVTLTSVTGNDAPIANADYWLLNGSAYGDTDPLTNPMVGLEDGVITFPVSLLIEGQDYDGFGPYGADTDEEGDAISLASISSAFGTVAIVGDNVVFTPYADVNSGNEFGGLEWYRISLVYTVTDGDKVSAPASAYLLVLPENDVPVLANDEFTVYGDGPFTLAIGQEGGAYDVLANDTIADNYPYGPYYPSFISSVAAVSGIESIFWDGSELFVTLDGSGDPVVFEYTVMDNEGDTATAQVTLDVQPLAPVLFYFSGETFQNGRELWVYNPDSSLNGFGDDPFATMVDEAETAFGQNSGNPLEITALGNTVFWRGFNSESETWYAYSPSMTLQYLLGVNSDAFDQALDFADRTLSVRAGDFVWMSSYSETDSLVGVDAQGGGFYYAYLLGYDRTLLTDAGHDPAYAALDGTYDWVADSYGDAEQVFVVLFNPSYGGVEVIRATDGGNAANDITEIAAQQIVQSPEGDGNARKVIYFAGDFTGDDGVFRENALWTVTLEYIADDSLWTSNQLPRYLDNGSGGTIAREARVLTMAETPYDDEIVERLYFFGRNAGGQGEIVTQYDDTYGASGTSTGTTYFGQSFDGIAIRPWENGVVFSGVVEDGTAFVATYTDAEGDGFFAWENIFTEEAGTIEELSVDGLGRVAFVWDQGDLDTLYILQGTQLSLVSQIFGEIDEVELAGGHMVWRAGEVGVTPTLFSAPLDSLATFEIPTDEPTGTGGTADGFGSSYANVAVAGGLVFEATDGNFFALYAHDGTTLTRVAEAEGGILRFSEGAVLGGNWVGTGFSSGINPTSPSGLFEIAADGSHTMLYATAGEITYEAEVVGDQVLFGVTASGGGGTVSNVLVYDKSANATTVLLADHLLGAAETVGGAVIFSAFDFANPANTDGSFTNNVWDLYRYDGVSAEKLISLPTGGGGGQPVYEWWRQVDFLGDDARVFWKQVNDAVGVEVHTIDLTAADPASTLAIVDVLPGTGSGTDWGDAVFANGRLYWQATADGSTDQLRLWTTTDGTDAVVVTSDALNDGLQFPYLPAVIGNEVFFVGFSDVSLNYGIFQLNDDGVTASLISPADADFIYGLTAIDGALYFIENASGIDQIFRMEVGATPAEAAAPVQVTSFTEGALSMNDIFEGGDGTIYFRREDTATGRELWVLDPVAEAGAVQLADINTTLSTPGYAPDQVVAVPDPLEAILSGTWGYGGGGGVLT